MKLITDKTDICIVRAKKSSTPNQGGRARTRFQLQLPKWIGKKLHKKLVSSLHASRWHVNTSPDENDEMEQHEESGGSELLALVSSLHMQTK